MEEIRILVVLGEGAGGGRAVDLACRLGRDRHAVIHCVEATGRTQGRDHAAREVRRHSLRVQLPDGLVDGPRAMLRLVRRIKPVVLILAIPRRPGWRWLPTLWTSLRRVPCEVIVSRE